MRGGIRGYIIVSLEETRHVEVKEDVYTQVIENCITRNETAQRLRSQGTLDEAPYPQAADRCGAVCVSAHLSTSSLEQSARGSMRLRQLVG